MRHINIPIFIPHMGCPNLCVFCNQRTISGTCFFREESVSEIIEKALSTADDAAVEIAFFGGSFTGIERSLMIRLLDTAQSYVNDGKVIGIRMSTRPDYIDGEIIGILKRYTVTEVELGIQSMSECVLEKSRRGHTTDVTEKAVSLLIGSGFRVVGQMMVGLPGASVEDEIKTAEKICEMGCVGSRIYPTVVFRGTELYDMMLRGEYKALDLDEAVERCAKVLAVFEKNGVKCLRVGLCENENLHSDETYAAGPNHSSVGELVMSRLYYDIAEKKIKEALCELKKKDENASVKQLVIECPYGAVSKVTGNKKLNKLKISEVFGIKNIKVVENKEILGYNIKIRLVTEG